MAKAPTKKVVKAGEASVSESGEAASAVVAPKDGETKEQRKKKWVSLTKEQKDQVVLEGDKEANLTSEALAERWGVPVGTISNRRSLLIKTGALSPSRVSRTKKASAKRTASSPRFVVVHDLKPLRKKVAALLDEIDAMIAMESSS